MRILTLLIIVLSAASGCDERPNDILDAGSTRTDGAHPDATLEPGPAPECGRALVPTQPFCQTCVTTTLEIDPATGYFERFADIVAVSDEAALIGYRGQSGRARMALVEVSSGVSGFEAPLRGFGSALFARTAQATYALGRDLDNGSRAMVLPYEDTGFGGPLTELTGLTGPGFAGDSDDCLHVLLNGEDGLELFRVAGGQVFLMRDYDHFRGWSELALDDLGTVHVVYLAESGLRWVADALNGDGFADEVIDELVEPGDVREPRIAIVENLPHVLYQVTANGTRTLRYAMRDPDGWQRRDLAVDRRIGCDPDVPPEAPDETCSLTETTHHPIAVLHNTDGEVRVLHGETVESAVLTASCGGEDLPPDTCTGWERVSSFSGGMHMFIPEADRDELVVSGQAIGTGRAVTRAGVIHAAVEVLVAEPMSGNALYYIRVE